MNSLTNQTAIELTSSLIRINSTNPGAYESEIGNFIYKYLSETGTTPEKSVLSSEGRFNVRAVLPGRVSHPALVCVCHMDTVQEGNGWEGNPFSGEIRDGKIWGRGACDMKSGLACALSVFAETAELVRSDAVILEHSLVFIGTYDEEGNMEGIERAIKDGWVTDKDWVVDLEPTDGQIQMAHKGRTWFELEIQGVTAHASMPEKGVDAIAGMASVISYIKGRMSECPVHPELGPSTVTFGQIEGGYSPYVVPDHCKVTIDMRLSPPMNTQAAEGMIQAALEEGERQVPGIRGNYRITGDRPYLETNPGSVLLRGLREATKIAEGTCAKVSTFPGYTDTAVVAGKLGNKECMSYGPGSLKQAHKPKEFVNTTEIERCQEVFRELVRKLLTEGRAL